MKNKKVWLLGAVGTLVAIFIGVGFYINNNKEDDYSVAYINGTVIEPRVVQFGDSLDDRPMILVNNVDIARMTEKQKRSFIESELENIKSRQVTATYDNQQLNTTLGALGTELEEDIDTVMAILIELQNVTREKQKTMRLRAPLIKEYELTYTYSEEKVEEWITFIANQLNVPKVEPTLIKSGEQFRVSEGKTGLSVATDQLSEQLHSELADLTKSAFHVEVDVDYVTPTVSQSLLESVNTVVSSASSKFPLADVERTRNVQLAAEQVNGTLLMPGDEFSFATKVEPVTVAGGYEIANVFMDGELSQGVGGGICQVSSTMYIAQLRSGILPTRRRAHSLPVNYVDRGLDATYATDLIDYRYVNTLDYPIYISAYTDGNELIIEFWSNSEALNGLSYEPRVAKIEDTDQSETWSTYLRTYNGSGDLVTEKFIDNSTYRRPKSR